MDQTSPTGCGVKRETYHTSHTQVIGLFEDYIFFCMAAIVALLWKSPSSYLSQSSPPTTSPHTPSTHPQPTTNGGQIRGPVARMRKSHGGLSFQKNEKKECICVFFALNIRHFVHSCRSGSSLWGTAVASILKFRRWKPHLFLSGASRSNAWLCVPTMVIATWTHHVGIMSIWFCRYLNKSGENCRMEKSEIFPFLIGQYETSQYIIKRYIGILQEQYFLLCCEHTRKICIWIIWSLEPSHPGSWWIMTTKQLI